MNTISSLFNFLGNVLGANPNTLTTAQKTLVGAINEVDGDVGALDTTVGELDSTVTTLGGTVGTLSGDVSALQTTVTSIADYIVEKGTDEYGWNYVKYNSGRLEAERIWSVGQVTLGNQITSGWRDSDNINLILPAVAISGYVEANLLGDNQNSPIVLERVSPTIIKIGKATTSSIVIQGVQIIERLISATWK